MNNWTVDPTRLRSLREHAEIRSVDFARAIGCHRAHLYKLEVGIAQPSAVLAHAICRVLGEHLHRPVDLTDFATPVHDRGAA